MKRREFLKAGVAAAVAGAAVVRVTDDKVTATQYRSEPRMTAAEVQKQQTELSGRCARQFEQNVTELTRQRRSRLRVRV